MVFLVFTNQEYQPYRLPALCNKAIPHYKTQALSDQVVQNWRKSEDYYGISISIRSDLERLATQNRISNDEYKTIADALDSFRSELIESTSSNLAPIISEETVIGNLSFSFSVNHEDNTFTFSVNHEDNRLTFEEIILLHNGPDIPTEDITADELAGLHLDWVSLVTLSACDTASSREEYDVKEQELIEREREFVRNQLVASTAPMTSPNDVEGLKHRIAELEKEVETLKQTQPSTFTPAVWVAFAVCVCSWLGMVATLIFAYRNDRMQKRELAGLKTIQEDYIRLQKRQLVNRLQIEESSIILVTSDYDIKKALDVGDLSTKLKKKTLL